MKVKNKRFVSIALALSLLFGSAAALPQNAFTEQTQITVSAETANDFEYTIEKDGSASLYKYRGSAENVTIPSKLGGKTVKAISDYAFMNCTKVKSIKIPSTVTKIGSCAFYDCESLTSVTFPKKITSLGNSSFYNCKSLESIALPEGIKLIDRNMFGRCEKLKKVTIPKTAKSIGSDAFYRCTGLTSFTVPSTIEWIDTDAFYRCENLKDLTISNGVQSILSDAFYGCNSLKSVTLPASVEFVQQRAFLECSGLESFNVDSKNKTYASVNGLLLSKDKKSLYNCPNGKKTTEIPSSVTTIAYKSFENCKMLKKLNIPKTVTSIDAYAFEYTPSMTDITVDSSNKNYTSVNGGLYTKDKTVLFKCPNGKTSYSVAGSTKYVTPTAFSYCGKLNDVKLSNNVVELCYKSFLGCYALKNINIPKNVRYIDRHTFENCSALQKITVDSSNKYWTGIDGVLYNKKKTFALVCPVTKTSVTLPDTVESISYKNFESCKSLKSITIPKNVKTIDNYAFEACYALENINVDSANKNYCSENGMLMNKKKSYLITCAGAKTGVTIPDTIVSIDEGAFVSCLNLKELFVGRNVDSIGRQAFGTIHRTYDDYWTTNYDFTLYCYEDSAAGSYVKDPSIGGYYAKYAFMYQPIERMAGANRYDTAALISSKMYKTADTVILTTGADYYDALLAVPLAKAYNAPLLLCAQNQLTAQTEAELSRLKAKNVIIVSTNGAVGAKVKTALSKYKTTVIEGTTCASTAAKVAQALQKKAGKAPDTLFFATDSSFADALSASPVAAIKGAPIIYLNNKDIDAKTAAYLKTVKGKVKNAYIIGGDGVISNTMMNKVASALGLKSGKTVQRVWGANRYKTCVAVNEKFKGVLTGKGLCLAMGLNFPDALAGGVYAAMNKQPLFLADSSLNDEQIAYLKAKAANKITIFGGVGAVPEGLLQKVSAHSANKVLKYL